ncbi:tripartite tricarboxylate transporter substrate binding protein [Siccirubricoccus sp. KC 17139]|uniref:Tripartite tricarboxylate transporter substrate binding protein n=1 Tax=Siccirubricoccus soli TaxID=2899147 RepID=A0ABT1D812_9PROT|nr:tripartite tricarboxylate transporter substrate-binding protein [Siccirubricoccus soli]MCO6418076.1 tripartite tricarboxylate transporter substrate binding protein [Siccirubricoccus soli]MCP2684211.1 tripartite tricarboxylate transporter substrate-binding protein [Siccirubricoccus soli]
MHRRSLLGLAAAMPLASRALPALAQEARPVRLVLPFPAGGATDAVARVLAPGMAERLGQPVVIDNRPGAGGVPAAENVVRAAPDGLTLFFTTSSTHSAGPAVTPNLPYDVEADFTPVALLATQPYLLVISSTVPARTVEEFITWAKARPGQVNYGSSGVGTAPHLTGALFAALAKLQMVHVPYRGTGQVYAELRRGDVHALFDTPSTAAPHLASGTVRALGVGGRETPLVPGLPSLSRAVPGFESEVWFGLFGPARLPAEQVARLREAAIGAARDPALREKLAGLGAEPKGEDGEALRRVAAAERARWTALVRDPGIRASD